MYHLEQNQLEDKLKEPKAHTLISRVNSPMDRSPIMLALILTEKGWRFHQMMKGFYDFHVWRDGLVRKSLSEVLVILTSTYHRRDLQMPHNVYL